MNKQILPIVKELAAGPDGCSNGEFAKAADLSATQAGSNLSRFVKTGHIFKGAPEGKHARFFDTQARADAFANGNAKPLAVSAMPAALIAREVAKLLRTPRGEEAMGGRKVLSNFALAELLHVPPEAIDAALAPLVDAHKMARVSVLRAGAAQFDYRYSSTWVPADADFALCNGASTAPKASVSPVAPPAPTPAPPAPAPTSKPPAPFLRQLRVDLQESHSTGGDNKAAGVSLERAFSQPAALGWGIEQDEGASAEPRNLEADDDLVCAFNSLGEMVLDLGDGVLVRVKPKAALALTRFAVGCLPVLEGMAQRGEL